MTDLIKWITDKFAQPLPLFFFALGTVLLLLGVTTGFDLPVLKQLRPDVEYRWVAVAFGTLFLLSSVFLFYFPPKPVAIVRPKLEGEVAEDAMEHFAPKTIYLTHGSHLGMIPPWLAFLSFYGLFTTFRLLCI